MSDRRQDSWQTYKRLHPWAGDHTDRLLFFAGWDAALEPFSSRAARVIPSRTDDPVTSHTAAREIKIRAGSQRARLLRTFEWTEKYSPKFGTGLTDEEAMEMAEGVSARSEFSKRCSELREAGYIEATGETRTGSSGLQRIVSRITDKGRAAVRDL